MRLNKYAYFYKYEGIVLCMNLFDKTIFGLSCENYDRLLNIDKTDFNADDVLITAMQKLGIIVEDEFDEYAEIKSANKLAINDESVLKLTIIPTLLCNFNCWYCYEEHAAGSMTQEIQNNILNFIESVVNQGKLKVLDIDWFGGEPLLEYESCIKPLSIAIREICKNNSIIFRNSITTNGVLINDKFIQDLDQTMLTNYQITLDGNKENHNQTKSNHDLLNSYDIIVQNICKLVASDIDLSVLLRINYTPKNIDTTVDIIDSFPAEFRGKIKVTFQQVWQTQKTNCEIKSIVAEFVAAGFRIEENHLDNKNYRCYADRKNEAVILHNGHVFKCTARDFNNIEADGILVENGSINWNLKKYKLRFNRSTFQNDLCFDCPLIPACLGPCSQKIVETNSDAALNKFCLKESVENAIQDNLIKFYEQKLLSKVQ